MKLLRYLDPRRIAHGITWRAQAWWTRRRPPPERPPIGDRFERRILERSGVSDRSEITDPTVEMWTEFALSSVYRGHLAVQSLGDESMLEGARVLDVGCAYGGFLIAASVAGADELVGVDVDPSLIELAELNLADHHVEATLMELDIVSDESIEVLGRFDFIFCNDVFEHVAHPEVLAQRLAGLLADGGRLLLQIPNGGAVDFIKADGHYHIFGITLLDHEAAERLWSYHSPDPYGVEHYAPIEYYLDILSEAGLAARLLSQPPDDLAGMVRSVAERFDEVEQAVDRHSTPDESLDLEMRVRASQEIAAFRSLMRRWEQSSDPIERDILARTIWLDHHATFWQLICVKA